MEIAVLQMRVLAEAAPRVWIAVSGTLDARTRHRLHDRLRTWADQGYREPFLDLRQLRCADARAAAVPALFALGRTVHCHLIGPPAEFDVYLAGHPDVTQHPGVESAWREWE